MISQKSLANKNTDIVLISVIALHLCIVVPLAFYLNIWYDEAYSLHTTSKDILFAIKQGFHHEWLPPIYPIFLAIWRSVNSSIFFTRLFSIACTGLTIYVTSLISKRVIQTISPGWTILFTGLNPYLIWAAVEIRVYAFSILLSALLILFFYDGYLSETPTNRAKLIYFLLSVLSLYTHFFLSFILFANAVALLTLKRWRALRTYVILTSVSGLLFVPLFLLFIDSLSQRLEIFNIPVPFSQSFTFMFGSMWHLMIGIWAVPFRPLRLSLYLIFSLFAISLVKKNKQFVQEDHVAVWVITGVVLILLSLFMTVTKTELHERYIYPLLLPSILSLFCVLSICKPTVRKRSLQFLAGIAFCTFSFSLLTNYATLAKMGDWKRVAAYLMTLETSNQPIIVFNPEVKMMLSHYYSGSNRLIPIPKEQDFDQFDPFSFIIKNKESITNAFSQVPSTDKVLWFVSNDEHCTDEPVKIESQPDELNDFQNCKLLREYINQHYSILKTTQFYDSYVQLLVRK